MILIVEEYKAKRDTWIASIVESTSNEDLLRALLLCKPRCGLHATITIYILGDLLQLCSGQLVLVSETS